MGRIGEGASGLSRRGGSGALSGRLSGLQFSGEVVGGDVHFVSQIEAVRFETLDTGVQDEE